ncbi:hypothetical protein QFZ20_000292 [Flavobacterium sp. W4I14]|nr:hypothetical protein [Flavobacterium sp. W4I14]
MYTNSEFEIFKKNILKRLKAALKSLDIKNDFIEISTNHMGKAYEVRIMGMRDGNGKYQWEVVRVINRSIIPSNLDFSLSEVNN